MKKGHQILHLNLQTTKQLNSLAPLHPERIICSSCGGIGSGCYDCGGAGFGVTDLVDLEVRSK